MLEKYVTIVKVIFLYNVQQQDGGRENMLFMFLLYGNYYRTNGAQKYTIIIPAYFIWNTDCK
jgi:hypothetical protein